MALSIEETTYLAKYPMKQLTFDGINDLYLHPLYGAYTIRCCIEKDALKVRSTPIKYMPEIQISDELMIHHERCIDQYGCGLF